MLPPRCVLPCCLMLLSIPAATIAAAEPFAPRIDALIESGVVGPVATLANDAEFLRRITLDLHGTIPTSAEARSFIDDPALNKRETLIDRLMASPRFAVHMASAFDVMLMERRPDKHVTTPEWQKYLQAAFENNVPFDRLAREILSADGVDPGLRPAAKFFLDRDAEPHVMARDVGRIFFGMDLQCSQCHDHPLVDHYLQTDYFGLYAFVNRTVIFTDDVAKKSFLGEKADGDATYKSVFTQDAGLIRPQLPGENEIDEPRFRQGEDYVEWLLPGVRPVAKYSRRARLAELATNGLNRQFNVNIVNRLWAHLMGRGLVHPVDLHHPLNPPAHPEVLELLAKEFVAMKYDMRWLIRELALTRAYQRSIDPPTGFSDQLAMAAEQIAVVNDEYGTLKTIADESRKLVDGAQTEFKTARAALATAEAAWRAAEAVVTTTKKPVDDALAAVATSRRDVTTRQVAVQAIIEATSKSAEAAKLLPNDKDVATAVATLTAKQTQLATELAAVQKTIADQTAAIPPLKAKLDEFYAPADATYLAYVEARKPVDVAKANLIAIWTRHKADALASAIRKKRLDSDRVHVAFQSALANSAERVAETATRKSELAVAVAASEQQQTDESIRQAVAAATNTMNLSLEAVRMAELAIASGREQLVDDWTIGSGVRPLKQLTPEQMGWAVLQATGVLETQRPAADAEIEKTLPKASVTNQVTLARTRELRVEQQLYEAMRGNIAPFITVYAASAGQPQDDFFATPDQALFVANGGTVVGWSAGGLLAQRLAPLTEAKAFTEELYLSTLTRRPTDTEIVEVELYLASRPTERANAIRELIWSLVTSAEFRFNH